MEREISTAACVVVVDGVVVPSVVVVSGGVVRSITVKKGFSVWPETLKTLTESPLQS